jgi:uncharacterized protein (DUF885 family)
MERSRSAAGFASREAMIADMRTNPKWLPRRPRNCSRRRRSRPRRSTARCRACSVGFRGSPTAFGRWRRRPRQGDTTARYQRGSPDAGLAGFYLVNTTKLDQRPLWEIPALTVHEAVPGHHMQIALQQELEMPDWRKHGTFFTAFVEGWGLYSERLGIEMGLYDTPQKDMGRLGYEMWRAARLVVDTGIHSKGWTKDQAVAFMKDNTTLTDANIDAEVNRYISNPGRRSPTSSASSRSANSEASGAGSLGPTGSTFAGSTTRCSGRARCRSTRSRRRSMPGSLSR